MKNQQDAWPLEKKCYQRLFPKSRDRTLTSDQRSQSVGRGVSGSRARTIHLFGETVNFGKLISWFVTAVLAVLADVFGLGSIDQ